MIAKASSVEMSLPAMVSATVVNGSCAMRLCDSDCDTGVTASTSSWPRRGLHERTPAHTVAATLVGKRIIAAKKKLAPASVGDL